PRFCTGERLAPKLQPGAASRVRSRIVRKDRRGHGTRGQGIPSKRSRREDATEGPNADPDDRRRARRVAFPFTRSGAGRDPRAVFRAGVVSTSASFVGGVPWSQPPLQESGDGRKSSSAAPPQVRK